MAFNLIREMDLIVSTVSLVTASGTVDQTQLANMTYQNTWHIPVLDGFSFSQNTETQNVGLNEAGCSPTRGQRQFNTKLNPVDVSFDTYVRPYKKDGTTDIHSCIELPLWEGVVGNGDPSTWKSLAGGVLAVSTTNLKDSRKGVNALEGSSYAQVDFEGSEVYENTKLQLYVILDNVTYQITDVYFNEANISFDIEGIAKISWTGQGSRIFEVVATTSTVTTNGAPVTTITDGTNSGTVLPYYSNADYIKNRLTQLTLKNTGDTESATIVMIGTAEYYEDMAAKAGGLTGPYAFNFEVDGVATNLTITVGTDIAADATIQDVLDYLNGKIENAYIYIVDSGAQKGMIRFETASSGATVSTLELVTGCDLFEAFDNHSSYKYANWNALNTPNLTTYTVGVTGAIDGYGTATDYSVNITGGSLTISNNLTFLTPENLGVVNIPIGAFNGTRSITGELMCYLNTGAGNSGGLFQDMIEAVDTVTHEFDMTISVGGCNAAPRMDLIIPHANLSIPSIESADVIGLKITFAALGQQIDVPDEMYIRYYGSTIIDVNSAA